MLVLEPNGIFRVQIHVLILFVIKEHVLMVYVNVSLDTKENYAKSTLMIVLEIHVEMANVWMGKSKKIKNGRCTNTRPLSKRPV